MGIPRFYGWLNKNFPHLISLKFNLPPNSHVEGLYIDMNSPTHTVAQRTFKYALDRELTMDDKRLQELFRRMKVKERRDILFKNIGLYLFYSYMAVRPRTIFMMAFDGVAPKAKMVQQRMRRFRPGGAPLDFFDHVVISPGTNFMDELDDYIKNTWIKQYRDHFPKGLSIIYSDHREPGEGEHKIFQQMNSETTRLRRKFGPNNKRSVGYQVVLGADSDLIILSMSRANSIIFMREKVPDWREKDKMDNLEQAIQITMLPPCDITLEEKLNLLNQKWTSVFDHGFSYVDVTKIREEVLDTYLEPNDIMDFAFISFFVGNDFLPALTEFESVVATTPMYFTDQDIEDRYQEIYDVGKLPYQKKETGVPSQGTRIQYTKGKKKEQFNKEIFWKGFKAKEKTWMTKEGRINFKEAQGLYNRAEKTYEIFPFRREPLTGNRQRFLMFKYQTGKKWITPKEDVGALKMSLTIYRNIMWHSRRYEAGEANTFIVEEKERINYVNLYLYLKELTMYLPVFLNSQAAHREELLKRDREVSNLIELSVGIEEIGKRKKPVLVGSAFSGLSRAATFAIYDSDHADPRLPKQAVDERCRKWLEGAQWTLRYYTTGLHAVNTKWFYTFRDAPSILELVNYLERRIKVSVPGLPGIRISSDTNTTVEVERVNIQNGVINIYFDSLGHKIGQLKLRNGQERFIDLDYVEFFNDPPTNEEMQQVKREGKFPLIETRRRKVKMKVKRRFDQKNEIFKLISSNTQYATIVESFFSIMPIHVLKKILSPRLVDGVVMWISDAFPEKFEMVSEGKFYESQAEPKIPFLSPARVERAINKREDGYDTEINRLNTVNPRWVILHKEGINPIIKELKMPFGK